MRASTARSYTVRSTAYNSMPGQTDSSPFVTATGTRTRFGVVALSRDLLRFIPYGSRIKIQDLSGSSYNRMLANTVFVVEDTMNARMRGKVDVWMSTRSQAMNWGSRSIRITVLN
ncbi:MAG: 3D domain-containing protein [Pseudopedobacter sp.]|nr:3D domain-containing protein [Deinococcales bacterium]